MSAVILLDADNADLVHVIQNEDDMENKVFSSADAAMMWLEENAQVGWVTRIIDLDD